MPVSDRDGIVLLKRGIHFAALCCCYNINQIIEVIC